MQEYKLTAFSKGAGCGCKIGPGILDKILAGLPAQPTDPSLLVGFRERDDAAVYRLDDGRALIATTDFFTPIVDDARMFGRIAAANALSDVYAMGGQPLLAIAVLGWPIGQLPPELAGEVLAGAREVCAEAGIPLAGGHSIEAPEPFFGLSVNGTVHPDRVKRNHTGRAGDLILLTKPIGSGVLTTALKRGILAAGHQESLFSQLTRLNTVGTELALASGVTAMTDVTGFGLLGHLSELAQGAGTGVELHYGKVPRMEGLSEYLRQQVVPDATSRNWSRYGDMVRFAEGVDVLDAYLTLSDPQTNGGLLLAVRAAALPEVSALLKAAGLSAHVEPIGRLVEATDGAAGALQVLP